MKTLIESYDLLCIQKNCKQPINNSKNFSQYYRNIPFRYQNTTKIQLVTQNLTIKLNYTIIQRHQQTLCQTIKFRYPSISYTHIKSIFHLQYKKIIRKNKMKTDLIPAYLPVYIFNVLHIGSMIGLSFKVVNDYMRNTVFIEYDMVFLLMTLICMGSGYMMTFLFQTSQMGAYKNLWISWHNLKLLVTLILFLPVYKYLPMLNTGIVTARFIWFVALIFLSPIAKFYRQHSSRFADVKTQ